MTKKRFQAMLKEWGHVFEKLSLCSANEIGETSCILWIHWTDMKTAAGLGQLKKLMCYEHSDRAKGELAKYQRWADEILIKA